MGQDNVGDGGVQPARVAELLDKQIGIEARNKALLDAYAPAPGSFGQRMVDNTVDGVKKVPAGFVHSLAPEHIIPNVAIGAGIGAITKAVLPAGGPVAKVAAAGMGAYFLAKPVIESYVMAGQAENLLQMDLASSHLGDTIGGLPVMAVEGGIGAKLGSWGTGKLLGTSMAKPYVNWRDSQWAKLDNQADNAVAAAKNFQFEQLGIGRPEMRLPPGARSGVVPPYVLEELARTTRNPAYLETIRRTESLAISSQGRKGSAAAAAVDHKGAREVFDAKGQEVVGTKVRSEGQGKTGNTEVDNVYDFTGDVRAFYKDVHGRNSIDGQGMKLESTVNYGQNFENAFWDSSRMTYGRPGPNSPFKTFVLRDVTGHEISHGVTERVSNIVYRNQPGALNEHLSDVFGALVEQRVKGHTASQASWLVGEGIWKEGVNGKALRDMRNPGTAFNDPALGKDPQPGHMRDYNRTRGDNGGVHINSGIPNRAFVLFSDAVGGHAWEVPGKIWYEARANAGSTPSFSQFAYHTIEAAKKLGHMEAVPKLEKAWGDVGIKPSLTDTGLTDAFPVLLGGVGAENFSR